MPDQLPLFPLGAVLFPGALLSLHVFEERYRVLVRELLQLPEGRRRFGIVAIRSGREVGGDAITDLAALHEVGCVVELRRVAEHPDGRFDVVIAGTGRFRLLSLHTDRPFFTGAVQDLPERVGDADEAALLAPVVRGLFGGYLERLRRIGVGGLELTDLPADPLALSHVVAAQVVVDLGDRQALMAEPDGVARLRAEVQLLRREDVLLRALRAIPAPELTRGPICPH